MTSPKTRDKEGDAEKDKAIDVWLSPIRTAMTVIERSKSIKYFIDKTCLLRNLHNSET